MELEFEQGTREPGDGPIAVTRTDKGILITHEGDHGGVLVLSEYNAARILACLAQVLGVRINREDASRIKL